MTRSIRSSLARAAAVFTLALGFASGAQALTGTGSFGVSATVVSACLVSATTLNFGAALDPTAAVLPVDAATTMTVICTLTTPYTLSLSAGVNAGGASNFSARAIKNGTHTLPYQLYTDTGRATVWGDGTASSTLPGTGTGANQSITIFGRLPSLAGAVPGVYADTVTVTVTY